MRVDAERQAIAERLVLEQVDDLPLSGSDAEIKYDGSLVTRFDKSIEESVVGRLREVDPEVPVIGEEGHGRVADGVGWILDPIDGTANFARGVNHFGISLAYVGEDGSRAAAIWDSSRRTLCTPATTLKTRDPVPLAEAFCSTELDGPASYKAWGARAFQLLSGHARTTRVQGSVAVGLALVADGRIDLYSAPGPALWDYAAGVVLVESTSHSIVRLVDLGLASPTLVAGQPDLVDWFLRHQVPSAQYDEPS